ncbi:chloride channel protein [Thiomonas intermedia]|uniref:chloride channel protein n=1 Tax=Thiomonas intermedia TaxID=926 RepID=UPI001FE29A00|nr:chloride channel protein [Thiomonas intermedia]
MAIFIGNRFRHTLTHQISLIFRILLDLALEIAGYCFVVFLFSKRPCTLSLCHHFMSPVSAKSPPKDLPIQPADQLSIGTEDLNRAPGGIHPRTVFILLLALGIGVVAELIAQLLMALIGLVTHLSFQGRIGWSLVSPTDTVLGAWIIGVPIIGGLIVGVMARYGSAAIRGHGIPEAMEQVLVNRSRISLRVLFLKPLSSAISIGTGGPFGAEGPIIATGGALGSVVGQWVSITPNERKVLLAAGAAAGMAAVFGTPLSAMMLAIELLLFEFSPAALLPVLAACVSAEIMRTLFVGATPFFVMQPLAWPQAPALLACVPLGAVVGLVAVFVTQGVYAVEDAFDHLPVHWMWWPAIGAVAVGLIGWWQPRTLGVGYDNITDALSGNLLGPALWLLGAAKLVSWTIALGSGTSGGTLAPLMTIGACLGAALGHISAVMFPQLGLSPNLAALVGMAAIFAGSSRALFMSVIFALETTWQVAGLLPLLIGCGTAFLVSSLLMRQTIMTEKISRRGLHVPDTYQADPLTQARVSDYASLKPVTLLATQSVAEVRAWLDTRAPGSHHQGYAVVDANGAALGVITRKSLYGADIDATQQLGSLVRGSAVCVNMETTLAEAILKLSAHDIGRLPVIAGDGSGRVVGMLTRSDILALWRERLLDQFQRGR